jgi:hypothetical protein
MEPTTHVPGRDGHTARPFGQAPVEAADADPANRPGVPNERSPQPWPNSRFPIERMRAQPSVPRHDRPGKPMPPVYGTAVPLHGLSGAIRKAAYRYPDHVATHWLLLLLGDRVDAMGTRAWRLFKLGTPIALVAYAASRGLGSSRR